MKRLTFLLFLSALAISAAACGGDDDDDIASEPDVNDIPQLSTEEMACPLDAFSLEAVTGIEFLAADPIIETGDGVACSFGHESGELGIGVTTYGSTAAQAMETLSAIVDDPESVDLDFADDAVWSPSMTTLHVVQGDAGVQIQITDFTGEITDPLRIATELAEIALG